MVATKRHGFMNARHHAFMHQQNIGWLGVCLPAGAPAYRFKSVFAGSRQPACRALEPHLSFQGPQPAHALGKTGEVVQRAGKMAENGRAGAL